MLHGKYIALFLYILVVSFFPFFARDWRGVTPGFSDVNGTQHEPLQKRSSTCCAPRAVCLLTLNYRDSVSSFAGMTFAPPVPRDQMLFGCPCKAVVGETRSTQTCHLLYAESVFRALSGPVANQIGAVVSVQKLQLCLGSLHRSCKPGQGKTRLLHFIT